MAETRSTAACADKTIVPDMLLPNDAYLLDHGIQEGNSDMKRPPSSDGVGYSQSDALHGVPVSMPSLALCEGIDTGNLAWASPKRRKLQARPVEGRLVGSKCPWAAFDSIQHASRETGVVCAKIKALCTGQSSHMQWEFRWGSSTSSMTSMQSLELGDGVVGGPPSDTVADVNSSPRAADTTVDAGAPVASVSCTPIESVEPSACPEADLLSRSTSLASSRKGRLEPKPVQIQREGEVGEWITIPSLAQAARETGVPNGSISHLCDVQAMRGGWKFRWPNAEALPPTPQPSALDVSQLEDLPSLAARIRAAPAADRRAVVASLPEATRRALVEHLREGKENVGSRVKTLIAQLPQLLPAAKPEERRALLQGVRDLQARQTALLAAPDVATVAEMLREVTPVQRRILVEGLPEGTQVALREHLLAAKSRVNALKAATMESGEQGSTDTCTLQA